MSFVEQLFGLHGKTAFVTGGGSGIGTMIAHGLAHAGATVYIASRKLAACEQAAKSINDEDPQGRVIAFEADFSTESGVNAAVETLNQHTDQLHILVNNAGRSWGMPYGQFPHDAWGKVFDLNVAGMFHLTQLLTDKLSNSANKNDPARVVNVGSVMGTQPVAEGAYSYSASKAAVHHMTRILAREQAKRNITFNALAPGPFPSKMTKAFVGDEQGAARIAAKNPFGRLGTAEDIAGCTLFLCSRAGAYTSGAIIPVDGGLNVSVGDIMFE